MKKWKINDENTKKLIERLSDSKRKIVVPSNINVIASDFTQRIKDAATSSYYRDD